VGNLHRVRGAKESGRVSGVSSVRRPWIEAALWMSLVGPYFFLVYGACNWISSQTASVPSFYWEWERHIPFVPIFILPYMSIDAFFAASVFLCRSRRELHTVAARMLFAISASGICFLLHPLKFAFVRPTVDGWLAPIFAPLIANDRPFNLAPSLHISLRVILWTVYGRHLQGILRGGVKTWFFLIGLSTLLVWQHHFFDVVAGFAMALATFYIFPDRTVPVVPRSMEDAASRKLGLVYAAMAIVFGSLALLRPYGLWFLWPALSFGLVAAAYLGAGIAVFQKQHGCLSAAVEWALLPWLLLCGAVRWRWRRQGAAFVELPGKVLFGRRLTSSEAATAVKDGVVAVLDLAAESNEARPFIEKTVCRQFSVLDFTSPSPDAMGEAVAFLEEHAARGKVYVHCELGFSRSAAIAGAWLIARGEVADADSAIARLLELRPSVRLRSVERAALAEFANRRKRSVQIAEPESLSEVVVKAV